MNGSNSVAGGNGDKSGEAMSVGLNVKVTHGLNLHQVAVPSNSTFGDLKSLLAKKIGLNPETHMLLFQGEGKKDDENLQIVGVRDNSMMLLVEDKACSQKSVEFNKDDTVVSSRGSAAVAEVTAEVDKLSEKISVLQAALKGGTKIDGKEIIYLTEMLMRQLLKLDGIEAEGEGKVQRKMEVRRIQSFVETMDVIKSRNLNPPNVDANVSVATQWETVEPDWGNATSSPITPIPGTHPTTTPTISTANPTASPSLSPSSISTQVSASSPSQVQMQFSSPTRVSTVTYPALSSPSSHNPSPAPVYNPPSSPRKVQSFAPMPSSTKVTEEWVQFD